MENISHSGGPIFGRCDVVDSFSIEDKVAFLREPASYPEVAGPVTAIETHFAWVFLAGRHAYKLKKPVSHHELDYRSLDAREWGCREELRLNRRLAPSVYQGVIPLASTTRGRLTLGGGVRIEDWLVQMERLPTADMLDTALKRDAVNSSDITRIVATLVGFFTSATPTPIDPPHYIDACLTRLEENRAILERYAPRLNPDLVRYLVEAHRAFITGAGPLLGVRGACVVEGHGDLRAEHVCLGPPVAIIDCLEFSRELRLLDPAEEVALLTLEVAQLDAPVAAAIKEEFCKHMPHAPPACILEFYMSHRAMVRAKLSAWHVDGLNPGAEPAWVSRAQQWLERAAHHIRLANADMQSFVRHAAM